MTSSLPRRSKKASLMAQIREANERLMVAAVRAENRSEEAQAEATQLRAERDDLINHLRDTNAQIVQAAADAHALAEAADRREKERRLTPRQSQILMLVAEGKSNKEIGVLLGITTRTAETHRTHIMAKLDLHSMNELVRYAIRRHMIEP